MNRQVKHRILTLLNIGVWSSVVAVGAGKVTLFAKPAVSVSLMTTPSAVRISVDGKKIENGQYLESPITFPVSTGKHKLKIARDGFVTHIVSIEGESGESLNLNNVVLQPLQSATFTTVSVTSKDPSLPLHADINDGIGRGELPLKISDIQAQVTHILSVYPEWPKKTPRLRCRFNPPVSVDPDAPYMIEVQVRGGRLKAAGCQTLKAESQRARGH
jgi:hypothetical protein